MYNPNAIKLNTFIFLSFIEKIIIKISQIMTGIDKNSNKYGKRTSISIFVPCIVPLLISSKIKNKGHISNEQTT